MILNRHLKYLFNAKSSARLLLPLLMSVHSFAQIQPKFILNFNGNFPAGFTVSVAKAAERWANHLNIGIPVKVNVFTVNSPAIPFDGITFSNGRKNFPGAPKLNVSYVTSLANQLAGQQLNSGEYDMDIYFNLAADYHFGEGACPPDSTDLITLAMHEIGHGLGFYSSAYVDANGIGSFGNIPSSVIFPLATSFPWPGNQGVPTIYDTYIELASAQRLSECAAQSTSALGDSIKNGAKYFNGPLFANIANLGGKILLRGGGGNFQLGVDLLHLDYSLQEAIMSGAFGSGDTVRVPAAVEFSVLRELGWNVLGTVGLSGYNMRSEQILIYPNPVTSSLNIRVNNVVSWQIIDQLGQVISHSINGNPGIPEIKIDVSLIPNGFYNLKLLTVDQRNISGKFLVMHDSR
jgi:hypothetical protein